MSLFTDGTISSVEDLLAQDTAILDLARTEGVDLTAKLLLAREEVGIELSNLLQRGWSVDAIRLENVVVTSPLRLWHTYQTLGLVYRDAYNNQLNDRYQGKWEEYRKLARWASESLAQTGVGIVADPIPQALAAELSFVPGTQTGGTYYVRAAWTNGGGEEGLAGNVASLTVTDSNFLRVTPARPPSNAKGWTVFVGFSPDTVYRQNPAPLPMGQSWLQTSPVSTSGTQPGNGQEPNYLRPLPRILRRG
jgi:hypothetical protein